MKISVVIPVYNEEDRIEKCLQALVKQTQIPDEIIIVDNNCTDNSIKIAQKYPVRIIKEKKQGISYARNAGFDAAKYEIIGRIDSDTVLQPHWVKIVKETFQEHPEYLAISGPLFFYDIISKHLASSICNFTYYYLLKKIHGHHLVIGSNMAIRKSAWQKVKKHLIMNNKEVHEDMDLAIQVAKYGQIGYIHEMETDVSGRRITKFPGNLEYLFRYSKMLARLFIFKNYQQYQETD